MVFRSAGFLCVAPQGSGCADYVLQECYHCRTGHPDTLPKDFKLDQYYLRQGYGASRHFLPPKKDDISEAYITWLFPLSAITFSNNLL